MKKSLFYCLLALCMTFVTSCSDDSLPSVPTCIVNLSSQSLAIKSGSETTLEFSVIPSDALFNYELGTKDCQLSLMMLSSGSRYFNLTKIKPVQGVEGRYKLTIKDSQQSKNYQEQFIVAITNPDESRICSEPVSIHLSGNSLFSFSFLKDKNKGVALQDISVDVEGTEINISTPFISKPNLVATFETNADKVLVNGVVQESGSTVNDFSSPVTYKTVSSLGEEATYKVNVSYSGLPVLVLKTPNGATIPSKHQDWLEGTTMTIINPDGTEHYSGTTSIRGRGNSTWSYPKKPYNLKLDEKAEILGMPKHKRWCLLANWMDRTLLRNRVAYQIALSTEMMWNSHGEFVDVVLNGKHIGNYYLCEHIKVDKNRVNIHELSDEDVDGGFIMELDVYYDEVYKFKSAIQKLPYMFKDPDEVNERQLAYMQNYINEMEASLYDDEKLAARDYLNYIDIDSYIDWWFVHELAQNAEPKHPKSTYMYKDKGGKLNAGPVWDFDWETFTSGSGFTIKHTLYYPRFFQDPEFVKRVKERWALLKPNFEKIGSFIDAEAAKIRHSEKMNHTMWPITSVVNNDESLSFDQAVARMKAAYEKKLLWLDDEIRKM